MSESLREKQMAEAEERRCLEECNHLVALEGYTYALSKILLNDWDLIHLESTESFQYCAMCGTKFDWNKIMCLDHVHSDEMREGIIKRLPDTVMAWKVVLLTPSGVLKPCCTTGIPLRRGMNVEKAGG